MTPDRVAIRIEHDIPGIRAVSSDTVISTVRKQLSGLMHVILFISIILWIIVLLIMAFAFTMIVNERRRELGLLRAMGATKSHIMTLILAEASTLSAAGGAAGIVLGFALLLSIKSALLQYLKLPYLFPSFSELVLLVVGALLIAVLTGLLSALLPAVSAFRQEPYEAIRSSE
jgi:putative ABC transport system permease protein